MTRHFPENHRTSKPPRMIAKIICALVSFFSAYASDDDILIRKYITNNSETYSDDVFAHSGSQLANCGGDFTNVNAILYPSNTLVVGEEAYMYMEYDAPYEVEAGYILTSVSFNGMPFPDFNSSLCSNSESGITKFLRSPYNYLKQRTYEKIMGEDCPLTAGQHTKNSSFSVPNDQGTLKTKIAWFSDTGRLLLCLKALIDIIPDNEVHRN